MSEQSDMFTKALNTMAEAVALGVRQLVDGVVPFLQRVNEVMWTAYRKADMPYGDSQEGLMHWMRDLGEIKRHEAEVERIRQHHDTLISARKLGEAIRARREE